ncbi:MAG: type II toxin-antitoxin system HicB family antitoxin [Candidatus Taylorbacteria bacterium]|nr:type II toxin-antitoxin system HicB family antitoxin [Candidatus Taylorbacteria bacterium]
MGNYTYVARVEKDEEDGGYVAHFPSLPGCITQGETLDEVMAMARDALAGWLSVSKEQGWEIPHEKTSMKKRQKEFALPVSVSVG